MFLGNVLIGSLQPAQQIGLVQAKNLKKLQIFCKKERLNKSAETCLIEHSEGLESILEYTLKNYGAFQEENNDLFFKHHRTNKELLLLFLQVVEPNFDYMMEMLQLFKEYPQVGECFKQNFQKLSDGDKAEFINQLKQDEKLFCAFWWLIPIKITEVSLFEAFLDYYQNQLEVLKSYLSMYNLPQDFQKVLQRKQLWSLIESYNNIHQDFVFLNPIDYCAFCHAGDQMQGFRVTASAEAGIFEDKALLLSLASRNCIVNRENKIRFIKLYGDYPSEVEQYFAKYEQDINLTADEQFEIAGKSIRLIFVLKDVSFKTEALLFDEENENTLLEYASTRRFQYHDNEMSFLLLGQKYPSEVEQYFAKYEQDINLTADEQFEIAGKSIRLIFVLKDVSFKTEALLFDEENENTLLEYASTRRFQYHDNEMSFLLLGQKYPSEVEQYLIKYGKSIDFSEEEQLKVLQCQKNLVEHIKVQSPVVYRDYVLPEKRKKHIPCSEEDLAMLIHLSLDNPLPLEQFIVEHGRVSPQLEAELFFKAAPECREKYIELYGVDLLNLVQNAAQYGVTETEQQMLNQSNFANLPTHFTLLKKWNMFQTKEIKEMSWCDLGKKISELNIQNSCPSELRCEDCKTLRGALPIVLPILINIARRNYLRGGC